MIIKQDKALYIVKAFKFRDVDWLIVIELRVPSYTSDNTLFIALVSSPSYLLSFE